MKHHFDLESPGDLAHLADPGLIFFFASVLRVLVDRPEVPARFLILGSASPALVSGANETLAGRVSFIDVSKCSLTEIGTEHSGKPLVARRLSPSLSGPR